VNAPIVATFFLGRFTKFGVIPFAEPQGIAKLGRKAPITRSAVHSRENLAMADRTMVAHFTYKEARTFVYSGRGFIGCDNVYGPLPIALVHCHVEGDYLGVELESSSLSLLTARYSPNLRPFAPM